MTHSPIPTVHVVDDDPAVLSSIQWWLESLDYQVRTYPTAEEFLERHVTSTPSCLVADVRMPDMDGLELQQRLADSGACIPVIFLSGHGTIPVAVEAMSRGAVDFLEKPYEKEVLKQRIEKALERSAAQDSRQTSLAEIRANFDALTRRQREVLTHVVEGRANKVIAIELGLSEKTIELHRAKMMKRMGADSVAHLVKMWMVLQGEAASIRP